MPEVNYYNPAMDVSSQAVNQVVAASQKNK